ncbi:MAG: hypothetical protein QOD98_2966, partial [Nocardioidaceae bacterium]|nr:hypothetical protein [Nocardioidaceae bacterium]
MTPAVNELRRRARIMRRIRVLIAVLIPIEMSLYVAPPRVATALHPIEASLLLVPAVLLIVALSAAVHRRSSDPLALMRWGRVELAADAVVALAILNVFAFDQFSSIWTVLVIVVLEGAFRESLRGAIATWAATGLVYVGIQIHAAQVFPTTAPLDAGSIIFRALVVGIVAVVAGQLASQLEAAVERHRRSEIALAEQYDDLRLIGRVSRAIAAGPEARLDVCQAVAELSGAEVVMLYEPTQDGLRGTAVAVALDVMAEEAAVAIARADAAVLLVDQARRDPLTGLVNRRGWEETLQAEMSRAKRSRAPLSMLMLDLDGLKAFNDTHGHQAGDALIAAAARAWESRLRPTDVLARFGGDEFAALLPGCDETTALRVAEALLQGLPPGASCTAGIAEWDGTETGAALVSRADAALYDGKRAGGGRAVHATGTIPAQRVHS